MIELKVNPVFRDKIPPLTADEFRQLEENILADGIVREPLVVWNGTIVDGHHRWQIIQKHKELPFTVKEMDFADEWAAISWMCANQLGRRNITDEQKTYLLGKLYEARKNTKGGDRGTAKDETGKFTAKGQNGPLPFNSTAQRIANEQGVGENTVKRAEHFAKGLDAAEEVREGFREKVLSGEIKAPKSTIANIRKLDDEKKKEVVGKIERGEKIYKEYVPTPCATQMVASHEYNSDDFKEELVSVYKDMDKATELLLVIMNNEKLKEKEWRDKAEEAIDYGEEVIKKYKNMLRMIGENN